MYIKCWGSRGSIPVSDKKYLKYGGDITCIEIRTKSDDIIIVDAGTGIRRLGIQLIKERRYTYHFILTHAHWDHIMGFPFFKPLYLKESELRIHRSPFPPEYVEKIITRVMSPPFFPVSCSDITAKIVYEDGPSKQFRIGSVTVIPIPVSHPNGGRGYKFIEDGKSFIFLTDNELGFKHPGGLSYDAYLDFSSDTDLLIYDAEYTPEEYKRTIKWGHSTYADVVELALKAGAKRLGLFHLNQERTDSEIDRIVETCNQRIAETQQDLECCAVGCDLEFII